MHQDLLCILCAKQLDSSIKFICKDCQNSQADADIAIPNKKPPQKDQCLQCTYKNQVDAIQCQMCGFVFEQKLNFKDFESHLRKNQSIIKCKKCGLENEIQNEYCLNCDNELFQVLKKQCQICKFSVRKDNFEKHYQECLLSKSLIEGEEKLQIQMMNSLNLLLEPQIKKPIQGLYGLELVQQKKIQKKLKLQKFENKPKYGSIKINTKLFPYCYYCYTKIEVSDLAGHEKNCIKKQEWIRNISSEESRLTPLQIKAMVHMYDKSAKEHLNSKGQLSARIQKLGFSMEDLQNLQFYIQNYAPIIIQIHVSKHMEFFLKDTHYRSQFQTNKSSGSLSRDSRTQWQDRMFDKKYSLAKDFQRVKYGVINFTNDPKGVKCASTYGPSYFLLKTHVRERCTFTDKDSSGADASVSTLKFSFKVVSKMNDNELKAAFKASKALQESSGVLVTYKQLQIHGPIQFAKDVERIYVNKQQIKGDKRYLDMVYEFSEKFKVAHDFI